MDSYKESGVFPAGAGVILYSKNIIINLESFPRMHGGDPGQQLSWSNILFPCICGGDPYSHSIVAGGLEFSLHMRGWFRNHVELQQAIVIETVSQIWNRMAKINEISNDPTINSEYDDRPQLALSPDQANMVLGKRVQGDNYPQNAKDRFLWDLYEFAGFEEWGNTRVMYYLEYRK